MMDQFSYDALIGCQDSISDCHEPIKRQNTFHQDESQEKQYLPPTSLPTTWQDYSTSMARQPNTELTINEFIRNDKLEIDQVLVSIPVNPQLKQLLESGLCSLQLRWVPTNSNVALPEQICDDSATSAHSNSVALSTRLCDGQAHNQIQTHNRRNSFMIGPDDICLTSEETVSLRCSPEIVEVSSISENQMDSGRLSQPENTQSESMRYDIQSAPAIYGVRYKGYTDYSNVPSHLQELPIAERNLGGTTMTFPERLHQMLEQGEFPDIVSWAPHGRAFQVHKPKEFEATVLLLFFNQTKFRSFQRQLNLYKFRRVYQELDRGAYYHELFLRGRGKLCTRMKRNKKCDTNDDSSKLDPGFSPNFYMMKRL